MGVLDKMGTSKADEVDSVDVALEGDMGSSRRSFCSLFL